MKRWALLTVALYVVFLSILAFPMLLLLREKDNPADYIAFFYGWIAPILILIQVVLLLVPLAVVQERPVKRRKIIVSAVIGGIPMTVMTLSFIGFILLMILGENDAWDFRGWMVLAAFAISWLIWGILFWKNFSSKDPGSYTSTMTRWLLRGSILELIVAVPSHIISRRRDECCAPPITLFGIVTGLSIAGLSFGPGVFFLFAKRIKDKRGRAPTA